MESIVEVLLQLRFEQQHAPLVIYTKLVDDSPHLLTEETRAPLVAAISYAELQSNLCISVVSLLPRGVNRNCTRA